MTYTSRRMTDHWCGALPEVLILNIRGLTV